MKSIYIERPFHIPNYKISSNDSHFLHLLHLQYGKYFGSPLVDKPYPIEVLKNNNNTYLLRQEGSKIETNTPLHELDRILLNKTTYNECVFALHGAAVEFNGMAYLFLASTTSGKSTLASFLVSNGFGYITDDCILIQRKTFEVHPYNCPIQLRDGGLAILKKHGIQPDNLQYLNDIAIQRYLYTPTNCITKPLPIGCIYFITRSEAENNLLTMPTNERMAELMEAPITDYPIISDHIKFISLLAKIDCKRLIYKDMEFVADKIKKEGGNFG